MRRLQFLLFDISLLVSISFATMPMAPKYEQLQLEVSEEEFESMPIEDVIQIMKDTNTEGSEWQVMHDNNAVRVDMSYGFIMIQTAASIYGTYKFIRVGEFESDLGVVSVYRHCSRLHPPVLVRLIPGPTIVMSLQLRTVNENTINVEAFYISGSLAWAAHCDIFSDNKALRIRKRILSHLVAIGRASVNTVVNLVLSGTTSVLRGNSLVWQRPRRRAQTRRRPAAAQVDIRHFMR